MKFNLQHRDYIPDLLNQLNLTGKGLELGVFEGKFSKTLLKYWQGKKLYLVDAWGPVENYEDKSHQTNLTLAKHCLSTTLSNIFEFNDRVTMIRTKSHEAAEMFQDESLDFIYIDAAHDYYNVKKDLEMWWSKIKKGGLFCGHDYTENVPKEFFDAGVVKAVNEFVEANNLELSITGEEELVKIQNEKNLQYGVNVRSIAFPSWIIQK